MLNSTQFQAKALNKVNMVGRQRSSLVHQNSHSIFDGGEALLSSHPRTFHHIKCLDT